VRFLKKGRWRKESMSIAAHLAGKTRELRMPKDGGHEVGVRFTGQVLTGEKSVEFRLAEDGIRPARVPAGSYRTVEDYDPVLRAHCRL
jgi:hypothetical protein